MSKITVGELYGPAMEITTKEAAQEYLQVIVAHIVESLEEQGEPVSSEKATEIALSNLGYIAGYYDNETCQRVYELFGAEHPVFGNTYPMPEEAFQIGAKRATQIHSSDG